MFMIKPNYSITHSSLSSLVLLLLIVFYNPVTVSAKTAVSTNIQNSALIEITAKTLEAKIESINSRKGLDDPLKSKVLSIYQSAQDNLSSNESYKAKTELFNQAIKTAPETIKQRLKDIDQLLTKIGKQKLEDFNRISTDELIQREILEKRRVSTLDDQLKKLDNELNLQQSRPQLIREEMVIAKQDIEVTQKKISAPANKAISKLEAEAALINLKTLIDSRSAELHMLDIEAMSNPARVELLKADYKFLDLQKNAIIPNINAIENLLTERREQDAKNIQDALSQAEKELSGKHLTIQTITRENIQYTRDLQAINVKIENYTDQKARIDAEANQIDEDFKSAQRKISLAGLSPELGKVLREQRRSLANQDQLSQQTEVIQNETASSSLEEFKVEDKIKQLSDIDAYLRQIMDQQVDKKLPNEARMMIQAELRVLLNNQKELLNKLVFDYTTFLKTLGDFDFSRQQMLTHANKFAIYLDENLLWVKSSDPINWDTLGNLLSSVEWLLSPSNWLGLIKDASKIILFNPLFLFIGTLLSIGLLIGSNWAKQHLSDIFDDTNREYSENFFHTLQALTYTLIVILPIPFISYYFGWVLNKNIHVADFSRAIGEGLKTASISLLFLQFFYHLFSMNGIAYKYFQWQKSNISLLRKQIHWLRFVAVITTFIITSTSTSKYSIYSDNLGRLGFILSMIAMAVFWGKLLNPTTGLVKTHIKVDQKSWITQLRYVWYPAIYGVPLILVGFAIAGYYLSALQLQGQIISSMRIIFLAAFIHEIVVHWLTLVNRQLAIKNAIQKRKAQEIIEKQLPSGGEDPVLHLTEELIDIPKINAQTTRLLNLFVSLSLIIGFWVIWKNILPAFSFLDNYVLWQHLVIIDDQKSYEPVTLSHLMIAGLYLFIAIVSVRNFSGVMEVLVFRRLAIEAGSRYAVNQLANYTLVAIGFISIANELGGSWSQVQWLVAALSVGLGFGLQEIFANLVSGIILLFERPIRVSDTVTIGDITGKVSRIQMRATTLVDADQKEHVVPNKTFITSQLVNWSLSDAITRVVIPVGIAYDADVDLAHRVMMETVLSTPLVLTEPAPSVFIVGFGDNALLFSIRIFVSEVVNRLPVTHAVLLRLEKAFREHNINIPFPQQDIHIRSVTNDNLNIPSPYVNTNSN